MATGDAAVKIVGDIEERAVAIGDAGVERQEVGRHVSLPRAALHISNCLIALAVHTDQCPSRPPLK